MKLSKRITTLNGEGVTDDGWSVWYRARDMIAAGQDVTLLCIGDHDMPTPAPIIEATKAALDARQTKYAPVDGMLELREAIAARVQAQTGVQTGANNVFVANGGQGALFSALMAACDPGDEVTIVDPYYATYPATVHTASAKLNIYKTSPDAGFQPVYEGLKAATQNSRVLLINTPNNPTGAVYSRATMEAIAKVCTENDLWVLSDEVYDSQVHEGEHISPRQVEGLTDRTAVIGSLSKSHIMTGFRLGWVVAPEDFIAPLTDLANATTYGASGFIQQGALAALTKAGTAEIEARQTYTRRRNLALKVLAGSNAIKLSPPDGAMYVMLDIRATGLSGYDFAHAR